MLPPAFLGICTVCSVGSYAKLVHGSAWFNGMSTSFQLSFDGTTQPAQDVGLPVYSSASLISRSASGQVLGGGSELQRTDELLMSRYGFVDFSDATGTLTARSELCHWRTVHYP